MRGAQPEAYPEVLANKSFTFSVHKLVVNRY